MHAVAATCKTFNGERNQNRQYTSGTATRHLPDSTSQNKTFVVTHKFSEVAMMATTAHNGWLSG